MVILSIFRYLVCTAQFERTTSAFKNSLLYEYHMISMGYCVKMGLCNNLCKGLPHPSKLPGWGFMNSLLLIVATPLAHSVELVLAYWSFDQHKRVQTAP